MEVLWSDDAAKIREYLSTPEGLSHINDEKDISTPLYYACCLNRNDVVDTLIEFGANVNHRLPSCGGCTALHMACYHGHIDIISRLLNAGADVNILTDYGRTPFICASETNDLNLVKMVTPFANFTLSDDRGENIFTYAMFSCNDEMLDYLYDFCPNINHVGCEGNTYLHRAVTLEKNYIVKLLLKKGIDTHIENNKGQEAKDRTTNPEILALFYD